MADYDIDGWWDRKTEEERKAKFLEHYQDDHVVCPGCDDIVGQEDLFYRLDDAGDEVGLCYTCYTEGDDEDEES